jgi:uncharacterized protein (TIGR00369 family)
LPNDVGRRTINQLKEFRRNMVTASRDIPVDQFAFARELFDSIPMYGRMELELVSLSSGEAVVRMPHHPDWTQQNGYLQAGALVTLADAAASIATATLIDRGKNILSANVAVSLFGPAKADVIRAEGRVLKAGRRLHFSEARLYADGSGADSGKLLMKADFTLSIA